MRENKTAAATTTKKTFEFGWELDKEDAVGLRTETGFGNGSSGDREKLRPVTERLR